MINEWITIQTILNDAILLNFCEGWSVVKLIKANHAYFELRTPLAF